MIRLDIKMMKNNLTNNINCGTLQSCDLEQRQALECRAKATIPLKGSSGLLRSLVIQLT